MAGAEADAAMLLLEGTNTAAEEAVRYQHDNLPPNDYFPTDQNNGESLQAEQQKGGNGDQPTAAAAAAAAAAAVAPSIDIFINNVVCTFTVRCHLNLKKIGMEGANVEYRREYGKVNMRFRNPSATCTIWSSGKVSITGNNSEDNARKTARRCARVLQKLGFRVRYGSFTVVNVLGTCAMPFGIRIASFSQGHPRTASYEPELHPAVTYQLKSPRATLKIFSTGSITVTAPCVENISLAIQHIYPLVEPFGTKLSQEILLKRAMKGAPKKKRRKLRDDSDEDDYEEDIVPDIAGDEETDDDSYDDDDESDGCDL